GSLTGCASVPPLNFSTPNVGVSQKKIDAEIKSLTTSISEKHGTHFHKFDTSHFHLHIPSYLMHMLLKPLSYPFIIAIVTRVIVPL
ncbi:hypothetical protein AB0U16_15655, partial [Escherichia coli]